VQPVAFQPAAERRIGARCKHEYTAIGDLPSPAAVRRVTTSAAARRHIGGTNRPEQRNPLPIQADL